MADSQRFQPVDRFLTRRTGLQPVQKREEHPPVGLKCVRDGRNLEHAPPTPRR